MIFKIEPVCLADILLAIELCPVEISGFARAKKNEDVILLYGEPEVFKQRCSMGGTEFDIYAHGLWEQEMMMSGNGKKINEFRLWWHSHVYGSAFFSGTDRELIESWEPSGTEWWASIVGNKYGRFDFRLDMYRPERKIIMPGIQCTTKMNKESMRALMIERKDRMQKLIDERVTIDNEELQKPFERMLGGLFG